MITDFFNTTTDSNIIIIIVLLFLYYKVGLFYWNIQTTVLKKSSLNCFVVRARGWVYVARGRPQCARTRTGVLSYPRGALWGGGGLDRQQHFWVFNTRVFILIFSYISNISDGAGGSDELGGGRGGSGVNHLYLSVCVWDLSSLPGEVCYITCFVKAACVFLCISDPVS